MNSNVRHSGRRSRSYTSSPEPTSRRQPKWPEKSNCLAVFALHPDTTREQILELFSRFGPVERLQQVIDPRTRQSRGFCFVYFERTKDAIEARNHCTGLELQNRTIRVEYSVTQRAHTPTPGMYKGKPLRGDRFIEGRDGREGSDWDSVLHSRRRRSDSRERYRDDRRSDDSDDRSRSRCRHCRCSSRRSSESRKRYRGRRSSDDGDDRSTSRGRHLRRSSRRRSDSHERYNRCRRSDDADDLSRGRGRHRRRSSQERYSCSSDERSDRRSSIRSSRYDKGRRSRSRSSTPGQWRRYRRYPSYKTDNGTTTKNKQRNEIDEQISNIDRL